jgi:hypothetical protein
MAEALLSMRQRTTSEPLLRSLTNVNSRVKQFTVSPINKMNALSVIVIDLAHLVVKIVAEAILQVLLKIMTITDEAPLAAIAHGAKITVAAARNASTTAAATIALPVGLPAVPLTMAMVHPANATEKTRTAAAHHHAVGLVSMTIRMRTGAAMVMEAADLHMKDSHLALADLLQDVLLTMAAMIGLGTEKLPTSHRPTTGKPGIFDCMDGNYIAD